MLKNATYPNLWLGQFQYNVTGIDRNHGLPALSRVWQHEKLSDASLGTRPRYSLAVDEDVKKPTKQTNKQTFEFQFISTGDAWCVVNLFYEYRPVCLLAGLICSLSELCFALRDNYCKRRNILVCVS